MNTQHTLNAIKNYCKNSSGDEYVWKNKDSQYQWNVGRSTATGLVNGVIRKLAGIDATGKHIWVVAGSLKVNPDGTIARWTGLPRETQKMLEGISAITAQAEQKATV
jgi:hypothetical protein